MDSDLVGAMLRLLDVYAGRMDLQESFPEVLSQDYRRLLEWANGTVQKKWEDGDYNLLKPDQSQFERLLSVGEIRDPAIDDRWRHSGSSPSPETFSVAGTTVPAPQPETPKTMPSPGGNKITVDRNEFEGFLAEEQKFFDRSQALMNRLDQLENENKQLGDELQATKTRLGSLEPTVANNTRQADDSLRKARETVSRLAKEADKRISK